MNARQEALLNAWYNDADDDEKGEVICGINDYSGAFDEFMWYDMREFDELWGKTPLEIANMLNNGDFNTYHDYWRFDSYGNLESTDYPDLGDVDIDDIIDELDSIPVEYWSECIKHIYYIDDLEYVEGDVVEVNGRKAEIDNIDLEDEDCPYRVVYNDDWNDTEWIGEYDIDGYWEDDDDDEEEEG